MISWYLKSRPTLAAGMWMLCSGGWLFSTWTQSYQGKIFNFTKIFYRENILFKSDKYLLFLVGWRSRSVGCQGTIHWYLLWLRAGPEFTVIIFPALITTLPLQSSTGPVRVQWWSSHSNKVLELLLSVNCPETQLGMRLSCWTGGGGGGGETGVQILSCLGPELHWENVKPGEQGLQ